MEMHVTRVERVRTTIILVTASAAANLLILGWALHIFGSETAGWHQALRYTVRFSAVIFLIGFLAGPVAARWPNDITNLLRVYGRGIGLSFAAAQTIHFLAVANFLVSGGHPPRLPGLVMDFVATSFLAAMAFTSNEWARSKLGTDRWRRLHWLGLYVIWFTLLVPFAYRVTLDPRSFVYWIYTVALVSAFVFRLTYKSKPRRT